MGVRQNLKNALFSDYILGIAKMLWKNKHEEFFLFGKVMVMY